jgi:hypothetical protein
MDFKKTLLIACLFVGLNSFAQKRLEFNEIVSFSGSLSNQTITLDTVPVGKAYKITSFIKTHVYIDILVNNISWGSTYGRVNENYSFPIWLKEGDILGVRCFGSTFYSYHISGIEFNIVQ